MTTWYFDGRPISGIGQYLASKGFTNLGTSPLPDGELPAHEMIPTAPPQAGDIIFSHHGNWDEYARVNSDIHVILLTTQANGMSFRQRHPNLIGCEFAFPPSEGDRVVLQLLDILATGRAPKPEEWELLKRDEYPEHLLAAYLVRLAEACLEKDKLASLSAVLTDAQWKSAGDELRKWGEGAVGDMKEIGLEEIKKALAKIQFGHRLRGTHKPKPVM